MGQHWYSHAGEAKHFTEGKNGEMRDTNLRDARKNDYVPSVSAIIAVQARPRLDKWKENQILEAAYTITQPPYTDKDAEDMKAEWLYHVKTLATERSLKARDRGSEIHDAIEHFIKDEKWNYTEFGQYVENVALAIQDAFSLDLSGLEAETTFSSSLGYGGMIDGLSRLLPIGYEEVTDNLKKPKGILLDWKTKDKEFDDKTKLTFDEQGMQLAAYRYGAGLPNAICANVFISPSAKIRVHIWEEEELQRLFEKFKCCLELWKIDRKFRSEW